MTTTTTDRCPCGKPRAHLDADPDSQEWACRVPTGSGAAGYAADGRREVPSCPTAYQVQSGLACPDWCELPAGHDAGGGERAHRAAVWELDDRAHVSVVEIVAPGDLERLTGGKPLPPTEIAVDVHAAATLTNDEAEQLYRALEVAFARRDEIVAQIREQHGLR